MPDIDPCHSPYGLAVSFKVDPISSIEEHRSVSTLDGAMYLAVYRYERRGAEWWAVLSRVEELMPPRIPGLIGDDNQRLPEPHAVDEAEMRRREWAEINAKTEMLHV